jgi:hypothetical protein
MSATQRYPRPEESGEKLTVSLKYRHFAFACFCSGKPSGFAVDMLRYDRAFIPDPVDIALVRKFYEKPFTYPLPEDGIRVAKYWDTQRVHQHIWCLPRWQGLQWRLNIALQNTAERLPQPLRYRHYAVAKPITGPDAYGRPQWSASFPWELMQKEEACPSAEPVASRIERLLAGHEDEPEPIVLLKFSAEKVGRWCYGEWDETAWDLQAIDPRDVCQ